jgi:hypothetical protein
LLSLLASTCDKALVLLDFELNRNYIVSSFCINKKIPGSCCQGKCYLKRRLSKQESGESANRENSAPNFDWICVLIDFNIPYVRTGTKYIGLSSQHLPLQSVRSVFHPPGMPFA